MKRIAIYSSLLLFFPYGSVRGQVGIGTTSPVTELEIYSPDENTTLTNFTQALGDGGLIIRTDYTVNAYTPGIFWSTVVNNPTLPKAGIFLRETGSGTFMHFGTSNSYASGITNSNTIIDPSGNVGIGTNPESRLTVASTGDPKVIITSLTNGGVDPKIELHGQGAFSTEGLGIGYDNNVGSAYMYTTFNNSAADIVFVTKGEPAAFGGTGAEIMRIDAGGNVGIGATNPGNLLTLGNTSSVISTNSSDGSDTKQVLVAGGGSASITRGAYFYVSGNEHASTAGRAVLAAGNPTGPTGTEGTIGFFTGAGLERMTIQRDGKIGVGTTSPLVALKVVGDVESDNMVRATGWLTGTGTGLGSEIGVSAGIGYHISYNRTTSAYQPLRIAGSTIDLRHSNASSDLFIDGSGNVGIGNSSPTTKFHVTGSLRFEGNGEGANKILVSDALGNATWQTATASMTNAWHITGNLGTSPASNFIGTTDAQDLAFRANNTERVRILSGGNIGIGTTTPDMKLVINPASNGDEGIRVSGIGAGGGTTGQAIIGMHPWEDNATARNFAPVWLETVEETAANFDADFHISTRNSDADVAPTRRFTVEADGDIGINTTSPSELLHLKHTGSAVIRIEADSDNSIETDHPQILFEQDGSAVTGLVGYSGGTNHMRIANNYANADADIDFLTQGTTRMTIDGVGNVGIGTSSPGTILHLKGSSSEKLRLESTVAGTPANFMSFYDTGGRTGFVGYPSGGTDNIEVTNETASGSLVLKTNSTDRLNILSGGNVGIGITAPTELLHTFRNTNGDNELTIENPNTGGSARSLLRVESNSSSGAVVYHGTGHSVYPRVLRLINNDAAGDIRFWFNGDDNMTLEEDGQVGIGTTSPTEKFHVVGSLRFSGNGESAGDVLISDATGVATWQPASTVQDGNGIYDGDGTAPSDVDVTVTDNIDFDGGTFFIDGTNNETGIGTTTPGAKLEVQGTTNQVQMIVQANGTQTVNIFETQNSGGSVFARVNASGEFTNPRGTNTEAFGNGALRNNNTTFGSSNTAFGTNAMNANTTGTENVAIGTSSLSSSVARIGNTAIGDDAMSANTSGDDNVAIGKDVLKVSTFGSGNSLVGEDAMGVATSAGFRNVGIGQNVMRNAGAKGNDNVAIGSATFSGGTGDNNVVLGANAGQGLTTGDGNTIIGEGAASNLTTGSNNIIIGESNTVAAAGQNNQLDIGDLIYGDLSTQNVSMGIAPFANYKFGVSTSFRERTIYGENTYAFPGTRYAIYGTMNGSNASLNSYGVYGSATGTTNQNFGVAGVASNGGSSFGGQFFALSGTNSWGVQATASSSTANSYGVQATGLGGVNNYGLRAQGNGGTLAYGVYAEALSGTTNYGLFVAQGQTKITDAGAGTPTRTADGSMATSTSGGNRIYFRTGGTNYFVNSSGTGDYSEYFRRSDQSLEVGEIVAIDPNDHNAVRKADMNKGDAGRIIGIVSKYGTQNNNTNDGDRYLDSTYINIGLLGQVQLKVSSDNGAVQPGDALTLSPTQPGMAVKANEPCRIIGYAMTHYPYKEGEVSYPTHTGASFRDNLEVPHVMVFVQPGYWEGNVTKERDEKLLTGIEEDELTEIRNILSKYESAIQELRSKTQEQEKIINSLTTEGRFFESYVTKIE